MSVVLEDSYLADGDAPQVDPGQFEVAAVDKVLDGLAWAETPVRAARRPSRG